ncbi:MAG: 50S ribosomal protein L32 [Chloroflexota bacterium]|nr:50S ribosomal protein L32 [Chloroflexota bacterium]PLS77319.1 MAG: 50S ribosomal protein L32 [Chloroflexota bacterium]
MGAVPKRKVSRHRRGNRRRHQYLTIPELMKCPNCGQLTKAHRACTECGQYRGRQVVAVNTDNDDE